MKETVADAFISRFQLKPEEAQALKGTKNGPISEVLIKLFLCCFSKYLQFNVDYQESDSLGGLA